jgi:hypothetical protein
MPETSFPYANGQGVTDAAYERLMARVTANGRIDLDVTGNTLTTTPIVYADSTGRRFKVRANTAYLVRGFRWEAGDEGLIVSLNANSSGNPRLDLVVLRLDRTNFTVRLQVIQGTPAAVPTLPAVTQQTTTTGRYEVPIASVRVNNGATNIASGDVTSYEFWLAEPNVIGHSSTRPAVKPGSVWTEYDTGRGYLGLASKWHLFAEDASPYTFTANGSWDPDRFYCYATRRNGWVMFQAMIYRKNGLSDAQPGTDIPICTLPDSYRPALNQYGDGAMTGNAQVRIFVDRDDGKVTLFDHELLKAGMFVHFGPMTWPVKS